MTQFFSFRLLIDLSRNSPESKKIVTAIAARPSGDCWRFCRPCYSLANMAKGKKSKAGKQVKSKSASKPRSKRDAAKKASSSKNGTPDPTNPKRVAAILARLDEAYPEAT